MTGVNGHWSMAARGGPSCMPACKRSPRLAPTLAWPHHGAAAASRTTPLGLRLPGAVLATYLLTTCRERAPSIRPIVRGRHTARALRLLILSPCRTRDIAAPKRREQASDCPPRMAPSRCRTARPIAQGTRPLCPGGDLLPACPSGVCLLARRCLVHDGSRFRWISRPAIRPSASRHINTSRIQYN